MARPSNSLSLSLISGIVAIVAIAVLVVYAAQSYRSDPGVPVTITEYDAPGYTVTNSGSNSYFIPTNTKAEFDAFRSAAPSLNNVVVTPIPSLPDLKVEILSQSIAPSGFVRLETRVCNDGTVAAPESWVVAGIKGDTSPLACGGFTTVSGFYKFDALSMLACQTKFLDIPPHNGNVGTTFWGYTIGYAQADYNCQVSELDNNNNFASISGLPLSKYAHCHPVGDESSGVSAETIYYSSVPGPYTRVANNLESPGCSDGFSAGTYKACNTPGSDGLTDYAYASFTYPNIYGEFADHRLPIGSPFNLYTCNDQLD